MVLRKLLALVLAVALIGTGFRWCAAGKRKSKGKRSAAIAARVRRMSQAFVASADLRPMAEQLLENRTAAAYAGVQKFAEAHNNEDAGALAWLVIGYAHLLDNQYANATPALKKAQPHGGVPPDNEDYFPATSRTVAADSQMTEAKLRDFYAT